MSTEGYIEDYGGDYGAPITPVTDGYADGYGDNYGNKGGQPTEPGVGEQPGVASQQQDDSYSDNYKYMGGQPVPPEVVVGKQIGVTQVSGSESIPNVENQMALLRNEILALADSPEVIDVVEWLKKIADTSGADPKMPGKFNIHTVVQYASAVQNSDKTIGELKKAASFPGAPMDKINSFIRGINSATIQNLISILDATVDLSR